ncbi:MAG TPA: homoserine kinase [Thermoanaerobaculia bacterium]|nr:homoserine kinase [Thermoanaerobaculia bacterium]
MTIASAFAPGSIGNVGPGFDVLGLAVEGIGDRVSVALTDGPSAVDAVTGRDAELVPRDPAANVANLAAMAFLRNAGRRENVIVSIEKGLPLSGGLGGSAASSVAGAYAAALAAGVEPSSEEILKAALAGESVVSGWHLDNLAPSTLGGLTLVLSVDPIDVIAIPSPTAWWVALVTPSVRIETKAARALLPEHWDRAAWIGQMAHTAALAHAFATGDGALVRRALDDRYAEPRRSRLIPHFAEVKKAALDNGALGCSISGSGPTIFAIAADESSARSCSEAMQRAFAEIASTIHAGPIARKGVRPA